MPIDENITKQKTPPLEDTGVEVYEAENTENEPQIDTVISNSTAHEQDTPSREIFIESPVEEIISNTSSRVSGIIKAINLKSIPEDVIDVLRKLIAPMLIEEKLTQLIPQIAASFLIRELNDIIEESTYQKEISSLNLSILLELFNLFFSTIKAPEDLYIDIKNTEEITLEDLIEATQEPSLKKFKRLHLILQKTAEPLNRP